MYPAVQFPEHAADVRPGVPPYCPAAHTVHAAAPAREYRPTGHSVPLTLPATQKYPTVQLLEHAADVRPATLPYSPAPHCVHAPAPPSEYVPATHCTAVADVEPAGHAYPAAHGPLQDADVAPVLLPNLPATHCPVHDDTAMPAVAPYVPAEHSLHTLAPLRLYLPTPHNSAVALVDPAAHAYPAVHGPVHVAVVEPDDDPYSPAGHVVHTPAPPTLYVPAPHSTTVALVDPAGHAYPAAHAPSQAEDTAPALEPNRPAGQGPVHATDVTAAESPYRPAAHGVHTAAPANEYLPAGHTDALAATDPGGHAYPAVHGPEHPGDVSPDAAPNTPPPHTLHDGDPDSAYVPGPHKTVVEFTDPAGHAYPGVHGPAHCDVVAPLALPNLPASHGPLQPGLDTPCALP
jgi:hypothetical protein